ncbi:MAG: tRNA uridine-5-carboxymethylaminomethyl(34) synthesis GTPase MnmE [Abditibacteriota bacterium]|nr:tRNA uridine-5-carboxymethylaminomethyl(34) synthesis GTPase MnmE [Abditibacteriota bacterium]
MLNDTIVAVATPQGSGGMSVIRVSGDKSFEIVNKLFSEDVINQAPRTILHGNFFNFEGKTIDDIVITKFQGPHSYTGEDVIEISSHGNIIIVEEIINSLLEAGAVIAEPGEFTKRAFLNGKLDLSQAEAVNDLIKSQTKRSKQIALSQLKGSLGMKMKEINKEIMDIRASIEANIDFPEDVLEPEREDLDKSFSKIIDYLENIVNTNQKSYYFRDGMKVSLVGCVNVGKSSILNGLLDSQRAIVTDIPGTTRDIITESLDIKGVPVVISDTAGVRDTEDVIEREGVLRSLSVSEEADLIIMVFDGSREISEEDKYILSHILTFSKDILFVVNKEDISCPLIINEYKDYLASVDKLTYKNNDILNFVTISAKEPSSIEKLKTIIYEYIKDFVGSEDLMITNNRHLDAIKKAVKSLLLAKESNENGMELDCVAIDLTDAMYQLGLITGETTTEDILDYIFSQFCIGK